jgi:hypothetical protein
VVAAALWLFVVGNALGILWIWIGAAPTASGTTG